MAFDPKAFLAAPEPAAPTRGFNPKEFLARPDEPTVAEEPGMLNALVRAIAKGATANFVDEMAGGTQSIASHLKSAVTGERPVSYEEARDAVRARNKAAADANPVTDFVGQLAGGFGSAMMPGLGAVNVGGKLASALATGAKLGAISGLGASEGKTVGDQATDALVGLGSGALLGGASQLAGRGLGFVADKAVKGIKSATNPAIQNLLAMGAKVGQLKADTGLTEKLLKAQDEVANMGLLKNPDGSWRDLPQLANAFRNAKPQVLDAMQNVVNKVSSSIRVNPTDVQTKLRDASSELIRTAPPAGKAALTEELDDIISHVVSSDGNLGKLWEVKQLVGGRAKFDKTASNSLNDLRQVLNRSLNEFIVDKVPDLAPLNGQYAAISQLQKLLKPQMAADVGTPGLLGGLMRDQAGNAVAGAVGAAVSGPVGAAVGVGGHSLLRGAMNSAEGRFFRGDIGKNVFKQTTDDARELLGMQIKAQADKVAAQVNPGAMHRTVDGVKEWVSAHMPLIATTMPQLLAPAKRLLTEPKPIAEQTVRMFMPMLTQFMAPSVYPSELEGKVLEPQDRRKVDMQLAQVPGMSTIDRAKARSPLNKDGTIPPIVYVPEKNQAPQTVDEQMAAFAERLKQMGR